MDEFELIRNLFAPLATSPGSAGLRDDVAEIVHGDGRLIATADAIVEGVHFLATDPIESVAAKLVRVNVSDIIAKGGRPDGALLSLIWPKGRETTEIVRFAESLGRELQQWGAHLIGGDTTQTPGKLTLSLTLLGRCGARGPVRRAGACPGDEVWVTGAIGDGWLGLQAVQGRLSRLPAEDRTKLVSRYRVPEPPPLAIAKIVADFASASIDVSDGLIADAGHVADASGAELVLDWMDIPLSDEARRWLEIYPKADAASLFTGGDDYQTLMTAPEGARGDIRGACLAAGIRMTRIGRVDAGAGISLIDASGAVRPTPAGGWRHFSR
jgi:thiamine-monophosphate kinase